MLSSALILIALALSSVLCTVGRGCVVWHSGIYADVRHICACSTVFPLSEMRCRSLSHSWALFLPVDKSYFVPSSEWHGLLLVLSLQRHQHILNF